MVGVVGVVVIILMTTHTSIWCVVIIPVVAGYTLIGDHRMRTLKHVIIIVYTKGGRVPVGRRCMTRRTIRRYAERKVIRIGGLIIICRVTCVTIRRCTLKSVRMAIKAINHGVRPGQREVRGIVIKIDITLSCRMTSKA